MDGCALRFMGLTPLYHDDGKDLFFCAVESILKIGPPVCLEIFSCFISFNLP